MLLYFSPTFCGSTQKGETKISDPVVHTPRIESDSATVMI